jgi:Exostosin family
MLAPRERAGISALARGRVIPSADRSNAMLLLAGSVAPSPRKHATDEYLAPAATAITQANPDGDHRSMTTVYILNTQRWLYTRLTETAELPPGYTVCSSPADADIIVVPQPMWPDPAAPEPWWRSVRWLPRLFIFSQRDDPLVWAPGLYASASSADPLRDICRGGFYVPITHYDPPHKDQLAPRPGQEPDLLWSFVGSVRTSPTLRGQILLLDDRRGLARDTARWITDRWHETGPESEARWRSLEDYGETLHRSKFVVCPRGYGHSSVRLFEAMRVGRCPVIISDHWIPPTGVDWESCAIRIAEKDIRALPALLREREPDAAALGAAARDAWEKHFAPATMLSSIVEACVELRADGIGLRTRIAAPPRAGASQQGARRGYRRARQLMRSLAGSVFGRLARKPSLG